MACLIWGYRIRSAVWPMCLSCTSLIKIVPTSGQDGSTFRGIWDYCVALGSVLSVIGSCCLHFTETPQEQCVYFCHHFRFRADICCLSVKAHNLFMTSAWCHFLYSATLCLDTVMSYTGLNLLHSDSSQPASHFQHYHLLQHYFFSTFT